MEKEDTILNNSQDQEECKINDSNKNFDKDLCLFLPKNIVEEISEKKTDNTEISGQSQFPFNSIKSSPFNKSKFKDFDKKNNHFDINNKIKFHMNNHNKNGNYLKNNFNNNHNSEYNIKLDNDINNLKNLNFITNIQNINNINNINNALNSFNNNSIFSYKNINNINNINNIISNNININQLDDIKILKKLYNDNANNQL